MSKILDLPALALDWHDTKRDVAMATVIETWGSAPRPAGSQLIVDAQGAMEGSVSGGCVEGAVITEAIDALSEGKPRVLEYGVSDDEAFAVGLACGGRIRVLVEPVGTAMPRDRLARIVKARAEREPIAYVIDIDTGAARIAPLEEFPEQFRLDRSGLGKDGRTFVGVHNPPLRLIVVGAVHIAQHLLPMARACGYDPILVDPRAAFAATARFPGEIINDDWPDEALAAIGLDMRTAVVTLTHDPKLDDPAISAALRANVLYLGCLGSKRTHAKRVERLEAAGFPADQIAKIHAPVGLPIAGRSPAEIALSIMAELTLVLRSAPQSEGAVRVALAQRS